VLVAKEEDINMPCFLMQDLQNILSKLRGQYQYCLYCGCKVSFVQETQFFFFDTASSIPYTGYFFLLCSV
jgi:hypothetical protein